MQRQGASKKKRRDPGASERTTSSGEVRVETEEQHTSSDSGKLSRSRRPGRLQTLELHEHDLPTSVFNDLSVEASLGADTETGGLDYRKQGLALVQLATTRGDVHMVRRPDHKSHNLRSLLFTGNPIKIFHHCLFDLRFIKAGMAISPMWVGIECTKTLMKIAHPELHAGLAAALRDVLGARISKAEQKTDWFADELTEEQLWYACADVLYLHELKDKLYTELSLHQRTVYRNAVHAIVIKAGLEVEGYTDLLDYDKGDSEVVISNRNWWRKLSVERGD